MIKCLLLILLLAGCGKAEVTVEPCDNVMKGGCVYQKSGERCIRTCG
jgi:hypothetical protein